MAEYIEPFLEGVPNNVAITVVLDEWIISTEYFIRKQFTLVLLWAFKIYKAQGNTLDIAIIDISKSERCCSMTLVVLS